MHSDPIVDAARAVLARNPGMTADAAYRAAFAADPALLDAWHGAAPDPDAPSSVDLRMVDPGALIMQHAAMTGATFAATLREFPVLAAAWNEGRMVQASAPGGAPGRTNPAGAVVHFKAPAVAAGQIAGGRISNVPVFKIGTHNGKSWSRAALQSMVEAFPLVGFAPPITIGHTDDPAALAHGRVTGLRVAGDTLMADFADVPAETLALIRTGRLITLSAEIYIDLDRNGRRFPFALRSVALLGAHPPGVSDLPPLSESVS